MRREGFSLWIRIEGDGAGAHSEPAVLSDRSEEPQVSLIQ